ncbi:response regulator [Paracraurococcus ruber]|uniref:response regulator n=1 Tax=Paracraurococcus ruber TaxID=77675 RepID=UPI001F0068EF|nr:response regulator [Paracraurococcus ruber]
MSGFPGVPIPRRDGHAPLPPGLLAEQVAQIYRETPMAAGVGGINAALMAALLLQTEGEQRALTWLLAMLLISALRLVTWLAWRRDPAARGRARHWGRIGTAGAICAGIGFGAGGAWLWPDTAAGQFAWIFLIGGMCAGAAGLHHAHLPTALGFILPAALPFAAIYAGMGSPDALSASAMILVFVAALTASAWRSSREFTANLRLRLDLAEQARALEEANSRLREEMARHRATEATLRQAQKMEAVGQLTGGIAHDFNNLLTAVLGSLALLRKRLPAGDARAARLLENAAQGAQRGASLTQRLLAFGRRQALNPTAVDLAALVQGMAALLRGVLGGAVHVRTEFPPGLPPAWVDANQLELAVLNLAANARDALPAGGEILVGGAARRVAQPQSGGLPPGDYVVLSVSDAGEGMDEATLAQAMAPFFTTKGVGKGTGLGLAMVHGLAAQSGGGFLLRSARGVGTVAELWLPRASAEAGLAEDAPDPPRAGSLPASPGVTPGGRVLVVDDDALVRASVVAMLEDLGLSVAEAASGPEALARLRAGMAADLLLTDFAMPGMTGVQLAEAARGLRPDLPVLLASGYAELEASGTGGFDLLAKPFVQDELAHAVAARLGVRGPVAPPQAGLRSGLKADLA